MEIRVLVDDHLTRRALSDQRGGITTARSTLAEHDVTARMMMLPASALTGFDQKLYEPFSRFAIRVLRHDCDLQDQELSRGEPRHIPLCDDEGIMNCNTFAHRFARHFHKKHFVNEYDYQSIGYKAKEQEPK